MVGLKYQWTCPCFMVEIVYGITMPGTLRCSLTHDVTLRARPQLLTYTEINHTQFPIYDWFEFYG